MSNKINKSRQALQWILFFHNPENLKKKSKKKKIFTKPNNTLTEIEEKKRKITGICTEKL